MRKANNARKIIDDKENAIIKSIVLAESKHDKTVESMKAIEQQKKNLAKNAADVQECSHELSRLNFKATEKAAVLKYKQDVFKSQIKLLDTIKNEHFPFAIKTGSVKSFKEIISDSVLRDIKRALLKAKNAFTEIQEQMAEKRRLFIASEQEYGHTLDQSEEHII